jgi:hypothetical protein
MRAGIIVNVIRADRHRLEAIIRDRGAWPRYSSAILRAWPNTPARARACARAERIDLFGFTLAAQLILDALTVASLTRHLGEPVARESANLLPGGAIRAGSPKSRPPCVLGNRAPHCLELCSPYQIAICRPISTTLSPGSRKKSVTWAALRSMAAKSASCQCGSPLPSARTVTVSWPT